MAMQVVFDSINDPEIEKVLRTRQVPHVTSVKIRRSMEQSTLMLEGVKHDPKKFMTMVLFLLEHPYSGGAGRERLG